MCAVKYSERFYNELIKDSEPKRKILKFAFYNGFSVGAVCARIEDHEAIEGCAKLYIMTINVLAAYRRRGIASILLKHVLDEVSKDETIIEVYLHVQTSNQDAKVFYTSHGFQEVDKISNYYRNIEPPDAYLLKISLREGHTLTSYDTANSQEDSPEQKEENTTS